MAKRQAAPQDPLAELGPLPGGHHGLSREQIMDSQRERLLAAIAHEVAGRGYRATTITGVVKTASVSTRDFYEHFEGKEQCFSYVEVPQGWTLAQDNVPTLTFLHDAGDSLGSGCFVLHSGRAVDASLNACPSVALHTLQVRIGA